jgi:integrase/recombinase XerD
MKIDRYGQAKILTPEEIQILFREGLTTPRDRALFGICLYGAARIREACSLRTADVYNRKGYPRTDLIIRKGNTKGKLSTRTVPVIEELRSLLINYYPNPRTWFLFPGRHNQGHIHPDSAAKILRDACYQLDIEGVSTHSFRRTALTQMSNAGIPLRVIQEISGHRSLGVLQGYLEVTPEQVRGAASSLSMLGYSDHNAPDRLTPLDWERDLKNEADSSQQHTDWEEDRD